MLDYTYDTAEYCARDDGDEPTPEEIATALPVAPPKPNRWAKWTTTMLYVAREVGVQCGDSDRVESVDAELVRRGVE
jgi:hypothetical protein